MKRRASRQLHKQTVRTLYAFTEAENAYRHALDLLRAQALMLLMIPIGAANLGWMLTLAVSMAIEKNLGVGKLMAKPLGAALIMLGIFVAL
jgi:hypothetical protein